MLPVRVLMALVLLALPMLPVRLVLPVLLAVLALPVPLELLVLQVLLVLLALLLPEVTAQPQIARLVQAVGLQPVPEHAAPPTASL